MHTITCATLVLYRHYLCHKVSQWILHKLRLLFLHIISDVVLLYNDRVHSRVEIKTNETTAIFCEETLPGICVIVPLASSPVMQFLLLSASQFSDVTQE